ncbi:MAG: crotonase/enoyl-CoA hydratase family protein [Acidimicrobiales bacterium]|nr:crotonase/enoyl-CoA hydratase family protein [Acidimicrobiales bacterium]
MERPEEPASSPGRVSVTVSGGVADVRLNRPDKINALDRPMFTALVEAASSLAADPAVRAVVLSGEGRGFCAGLDFASFASMAGSEPRSTEGLADRPPGRIANLAQQAAHGWAELPVPVIAAVHGVALGGGLQIALAADLRIVAPDAQLSILEIRWGLVPDMTGTHVLPRLVPLDVAKELVWTGRMVSGDESVRLGLATRVSEDPRREALELAAQIAAKNPDAIRAGKRLLDQSGLVSRAQQFLDESAEMGALIGSPNQAEAVRAYFDRREPVFTDPRLV